MIKVIIFDADGMVINGGRFSDHLARDFGISKETTSNFFENEFQECLIGKADIKEELKKYINQWGWEGTIDELLQYWFKSEHHIEDRIVLIVKDLRQRGIQCYVATKNEKHRTAYMANEMGFNKIFDGIFSSCDIGYTKNQPQYFEYILRKLPDIQKEETLFWDDKEKHTEIAKSVGMLTEIYHDFDSFQEKINSIL